ncbi:MAG: ATP-dependent Clp protease proteolytic subunit [Alphaproteobacteria bacterium]|nr:ATP-dependent Clp protease proteolytic subunit [Alphaproteobacteria bacterium]
MELVWLVLLFFMLQPMIRQRYLMAMRHYKIAQLQNRRQSRVITLVHRQETMRLLGFPLMRYIDIDDSEAVTRAIHATDPGTPIDLVLHTPGGLVLASLQIARAIQRHSGRVTVFVPHLAMSGGTLIALAADQVVMCPHAMLGPVDPQVGGFPAASLMKIGREKPIAEIDDNTLIMADIGAKATRQVARAMIQLLRRQMTEEAATALAETLTSGQWTHDYPIDAEEARGLGLRVSTDMPEEVLELMQLYPQPMAAAPTVEYLPGPGRRPAARPH